MSHTHRPIPARRLFSNYRAPRIGSFDADYGPYTGDDRDPRWDGPAMCCDCMGTKYDEHGDKCPHCNGVGTIPEDM